MKAKHAIVGLAVVAIGSLATVGVLLNRAPAAVAIPTVQLNGATIPAPIATVAAPIVTVPVPIVTVTVPVSVQVTVPVYVPVPAYVLPHALPAGHSCRALMNAGYTFPEVLVYWNDIGSPSDMDNDLNGIPCETVYGPWPWAR
jgi:hypothetical protein